MKKMFMAWLVVAALAFPMTAYAQDATSGSITVTYEYTAPSGGGEPGGTATYTLNIPANIAINAMEVVPVTASLNNVPEGKKVVAMVVSDKSFTKYYQFLLYKNKGEAGQESILCRVYTYVDSTLTIML